MLIVLICRTGTRLCIMMGDADRFVNTVDNVFVCGFSVEFMGVEVE